MSHVTHTHKQTPVTRTAADLGLRHTYTAVVHADSPHPHRGTQQAPSRVFSLPSLTHVVKGSETLKALSHAHADTAVCTLLYSIIHITCTYAL